MEKLIWDIDMAKDVLKRNPITQETMPRTKKQYYM